MFEEMFEGLAIRYRSLQEQYYAHETQVGEDGLKRFIEYHPMNSMTSDFLTLEQQARGTRIGFSCLYHLVLVAGGVGDTNYPVTQGKIAALKVLGQHYRDYPDIDTTFRYLFSGARVPETTAFLRELVNSSQLQYVRANALYELANHLALEANLPAMCESELAVIDISNPENQVKLENLRSFAASLRDVDIDRNRAEATKLIQQIQKDFTNELVPPRADVRSPLIVVVKRSDYDDILKVKRERILDRLPAVHFELNHSIGQIAPPIDGDDAIGTPMSLADHRGKVVALMFSFKGCGPCEEMYPDNRRLIEELPEESFVFLGVQGDETIDTVHESLKAKAITWRVWWDGKDKKISSQWNVRGWPSTFVLDQRGIIRFRDLRGQELENAVRSLLKENTD